MTMIYTGTTISFQHKGKFHTVHNSHPEFTKVLELCRKSDFEAAASLVDLKQVVADALAGSKAELRGNQVFYKGNVVHSLLARRIIEMKAQGFPVEPLLRFLDNLMENPSNRAVTELYDFLEVAKLPITEDGHFLAYKSVRQDFTDHHTGTMDNSVGAVVEMDRNQVDEDKDRTCSRGLHFAAYEYARDFGASGRMVVLKINPRDVVAIPSDYNNQKGRACRYVVLEEVARTDTKLVGATFVDTTKPDVKPKRIPKDTTVRLSDKGKAKYTNTFGNPHNNVGVVVENQRKSDKGYVYLVKWPTRSLPQTYQEGELEVVKVEDTYVPQVDNYTNGKVWASNASRRVFKGTAKDFPVNRDVAYQLTRYSDQKEYSGEFYFIEYTKKGNLVFVRYDREGNPERYVTVSNVKNWKITTPTKRI